MSEHQYNKDTAERTEVALPPTTTTRWVASRKAQVVRAVETGILTPSEAHRRYGISPEELDGWRRGMAHWGTKGLQATRVGRYRRIEANR